jgi:hypothetical protein
LNFEENELQAAIIKALNLHKSVLAFHVPNEGKRSMAQSMRMKALGVRSGVPDLVLMDKNGKIHFWELKAKNGRLSENQGRFRDRCIEWGFSWSQIKSVDEAMDYLRSANLFDV